MLVRIVKLTFKSGCIDDFKQIFEASKVGIRNFEGCQFLELYQDKKDATVFFTYSFWKHETHLNAYRDSDFFKTVWAKTKPLFADKPAAWSVNKLDSLP